MRRVLFVANGHGETAIAARIAVEVARLAGEPAGLDLLALVGTGAGAAPLALVGPRRAMPSGGLVAMGNVRAFWRDLRAGFIELLAAQLLFLVKARARYDVVVAVGDAYALALALLTRTPTVFVGTAKSVHVAPYGPFERVLLRRALRAFVRDEGTAAMLRGLHVEAEAPGNVIVDLVDGDEAGGLGGQWIGVLPGSRETAYADGVRLARVVRALGRLRPGPGALLSVAPALDAARFERELVADGWERCEAPFPAGGAFAVRVGPARLVGWTGTLGTLLRASVLVLGQAGTANEQAAAFGIPVVALGESRQHSMRGGRSTRSPQDWYRMRQRRLLGSALLLVPAAPGLAAPAVADLLDDPERLAQMGAAGRERMGPPGGAAAVARAILDAAAPG
jgi:uncharacterized protein (TIGR03492 family)